MDDADDFFAERDRRMGIPDEDVDKYIQTRLAATRQNRSTARRVGDSEDFGVAQHSPINSERRSHKLSLGLKKASGNNSAETANSGMELNPASLSPLRKTIGESTPSAARCTKRRKTTGEYYTPQSMDYFLRASVPEGPNPDPVALRTMARRSGASVERFSVSSSMSHIAPGCHRDPIMPSLQAQTVRTADQAVPVTEEVSGYSTANTPDSEMKVAQTQKRQKLNTPLVSTPNDPSVIEVFSLPPVPPRRNAAVFSSTTPDNHKTNSSGFLENSSNSLLADGIPKDEIVAISISVGPSSSRIADDSHEAGCIGETPVSRTPAGFNTASDVSNITSPATTLSGQSRRASGVSHGAQPSSSNTLAPNKPKTRKTVNSDRRSRKASSNGSSSKQVKEKPKLTTPLEYAQKLQSCLDLHVKTSYLKGKRIFYVGGDMMYASTTTRGRMEYIVKHGGTLVPKYDPAIVTHIVTDAAVRHTLKALSLKSLSDIPENIPTVTWDWVVSGYGRASKRKSKLPADKDAKGEENEGEGDHGDENDLFDFEFMHAAFPERIDAGPSWKNNRWVKQAGKAARGAAAGAESAQDDSGDISHISTFSQEGKPTQTEGRGVSLTVLPPLPLNLKFVDSGKSKGHATSEAGEKAPQNDPLSEYYAQARADREAQWSQDASESDEDNDFDYYRGPAPRRGFACDLKGHKPSVCVNQHIVDKLEELRELHKAKSSEHDRWRAYSYGKCIPALRNYPKPIRSFSEARSIRGVGEKTALKIMEIINTGDLERIKYENTEDVAATRIFQGIYGVGRHTAFAWFASGLRTLDDVRAGKCDLKLSTAQEIGLKFYDDINSRMPREEARRIFEMIQPMALAIDSNLFIEIMGSYRRGKADCGDIDILITRPTTDGKTHQGVLRTLLERLHAAGIMTEDLAVPDDFSDLESVYRGLCKLPEPGAKRRRIDFLCVPWVNRGAALLYYTGDDIFNRAIRLKANKHGYSLNQRGLYAGVLRDPYDRQKKVYEGHIVASETEEEIFNILGVPWQEPHERVRG
ncbi:hypothetical protein JVT61DRAFT_4890 [Boletus reticuloceps]|uniref:DNA polymerase lambda n=1 Tax=Boletus reticuloceps TaxID=495285 RepID=A0A8I2YLS2_9AGAM|nr:hypothetical protein JVT61DRAFT_4890 [Boletus reticuloceps]